MLFIPAAFYIVQTVYITNFGTLFKFSSEDFKFSSFDRLTETVYELLKLVEYKDIILILNNSVMLDSLDKLD